MKSFFVLLLMAIFFLGCASSEPKPEPSSQPLLVEVLAPEPIPVAKPVVVLPKSPISTKLIKMFHLSPEEICDLQFYVSGDIELQKRIPAQTSSIENGALVISKQDKIKKIVIKKDTPCIAIKAEGDIIVVKFNDDLKLTFMHSADKKDLFLLSAQKWEKGIGFIMVGDVLYQAVGTSGQVYLKINKVDVDNSNQNDTIVEGSMLE